jgi:hypothetical protein
VNAGRLLREAGYDTDALRVRISPVNPDHVNVWPASTLMRRLWRSGIRGVTIWRWVFVDPELMRGDRDRLARLVIHELVHLRQLADTGYLPFTVRYVTEYLRGRLKGKDARQAYLDIAAETEAREVTARSQRVM